MRSILLLATVVSATLMVATSCSEQSEQQSKQRLQGPAVWSLDKINEKAALINAGQSFGFYDNMKREADSILTVDVNPSVTHKIADAHPDHGDKRYYMSLSRYTWPDPDSPDGRPYLFLDGQSNPELANYDRRILSGFASSITSLSLVYYVTGEQKYADKAISRLRTWFTDEETLMYPNFAYGQIHPGYDDDRGAAAGLLDGLSFMSMLDALSLLELKGAVPQGLQDSMQVWFADLTEWMLTSDSGIAESNVRHNHSVAYDTQIIRYAIYGGREDIALRVLEEFPTRRLAIQVEDDGSMPAELARTVAFMYTNYNIGHMLDICDMAEKLGVDLYPAYNRGIERAIDWMKVRATDEEGWPYQQINPWQPVLESFSRTLYRASKYGKTEEYKAFYEEHKAENEQLLFEFLYL